MPTNLMHAIWARKLERIPVTFERSLHAGRSSELGGKRRVDANASELAGTAASIH
jgi:hypothetical protein